jgi:hypothetical protein
LQSENGQALSQENVVHQAVETGSGSGCLSIASPIIVTLRAFMNAIAQAVPVGHEMAEGTAAMAQHQAEIGSGLHSPADLLASAVNDVLSSGGLSVFVGDNRPTYLQKNKFIQS